MSALLGYARVSTAHQSLDQQHDALVVAGAGKLFDDKLSGTSTREERPGLAALLEYAREGDTIVVVGIDRLGRNAAEVMLTIRDLGARGIVLRSLREGIDTSTAAGRMVAGVLAARRQASRARTERGVVDRAGVGRRGRRRGSAGRGRVAQLKFQTGRAWVALASMRPGVM